MDVQEVLTLNADMQPLTPPISTTSFEQAINRIIRGYYDRKMLNGFYVVCSYNRPIKTNNPNALAPFGLTNWPSVVARKHYLKRGQAAAFSKKNLFLRDNHSCRYCGKELTKTTWTLDHYIPKSLGGKAEWTNGVVSCGICNGKKDNSSPSGRWKLSKPPHVPTIWELSKKRLERPLTIPDKQWLDFLPSWHGQITVIERKKFG